MDAVDEELEAVTAIYCGQNEFQILQRGSSTQNYIVQYQKMVGSPFRRESVKITLTLNHDYPNSVPEISMNIPGISRSQVNELKSELLLDTTSFVGEPMIMDLIMIFCDRLSILDTRSPVSRKGTEREDVEDQQHFALLHLDHMRNKQKYIKTILKWTEEFDLKGRLVFQGRLILIFLQGNQKSIKDYITRQKTVNVDVDSKGRSCKERMLSVLCEQVLDSKHHRFEGFILEEFQTTTELQDWFSRHGFTEFFDDNVLSLIS